MEFKEEYFKLSYRVLWYIQQIKPYNIVKNQHKVQILFFSSNCAKYRWSQCTFSCSAFNPSLHEELGQKECWKKVTAILYGLNTEEWKTHLNKSL